MLHNSFEQLVNVEAVQRADGGDGGPGDFRLPVCDAFAHISLVLREVNFIDQDEHRDVHVRDFGKRLRVREVVFVDVRDQQDEVGILKRCADKFHHALLQLVGGVQYAGCIAVNDLPIGFVNEPHDAVSGGLRLFVDDAQAFTNELIHQGAFAHVRGADDVHKPSAVGRFFCRSHGECNATAERRYGPQNLHGMHLAKWNLGVYLLSRLREQRGGYRGVEQLVARRAHNPKVVSSSLAPATKHRGCETKKPQ